MLKVRAGFATLKARVIESRLIVSYGWLLEAFLWHVPAEVASADALGTGGAGRSTCWKVRMLLCRQHPEYAQELWGSSSTSSVEAGGSHRGIGSVENLCYSGGSSRKRARRCLS